MTRGRDAVSLTRVAVPLLQRGRARCVMRMRLAGVLALTLVLVNGAGASDDFQHRACKKVGNTDREGSGKGANVRSFSPLAAPPPAIASQPASPVAACCPLWATTLVALYLRLRTSLIHLRSPN